MNSEGATTSTNLDNDVEPLVDVLDDLDNIHHHHDEGIHINNGDGDGDRDGDGGSAQHIPMILDSPCNAPNLPGVTD